MAQAARKKNNPGFKQKIKRLTRQLAYSNPVYSASLNGEIPSHLQQLPRDPWAGDVALGQSLMRGLFPLAGREYKAASGINGIDIWRRNLPQAAFEDLHGFRWLRHLHAVGGNEARQMARQYLESWIEEFHQWDESAWSPALIGERLTAWLNQYAFYGISADDEFRTKFMSSLMRQLRHLLRVYDDEKFRPDKIAALKGFLFVSHALPEGYLDPVHVIEEIEETIHQQILSDGCHFLRSPSMQARSLRDLIEMRSIFTYAQIETPPFLRAAIEAMARAIRYLRHGDGGLALFHGSCEENAAFLELLLVAANVKGRAGDMLEDAGWFRLTAGRTLIIVDAGRCAEAQEIHCHDSPLGFEMSAGRERLIVNCGGGAAIGPDWQRACRQMAAHSVLDIPDQRLAEQFEIKAARYITDGNLWLDATHTGYGAKFIRHQRRIYLNASGDDVRGEDVLLREQDGIFAPTPFTIRFHLHPKIQVGEAQNSVILRTPGGAGWRIRASGGKIGLTDSVYLGNKGQIQKTRQVTIDGELIGKDAQVKWAIQKESKK